VDVVVKLQLQDYCNNAYTKSNMPMVKIGIYNQTSKLLAKSVASPYSFFDLFSQKTVSTDAPNFGVNNLLLQNFLEFVISKLAPRCRSQDLNKSLGPWLFPFPPNLVCSNSPSFQAMNPKL
jgi:hypothetical protein